MYSMLSLNIEILIYLSTKDFKHY
ncbi:hypothetical protein NQ315_014421 [Exocentrus adspersus]|uniref:Uncharacterized protein n=1 Tax=Exocentrus adspersus TaxID=1586481 RepID=A0AAV8VFG6_9CUCU|nr:hypothetical protein NQ315_014421 [Exocentrus adspersus]